ncbi:N-formylglutamate amidohydrolase [Halovulum dunhuangense]|uniref:N-formylglutamate amidohydrolase n=1 Tax=Halovulum dunhuangense TaxID=1505036 RepID=A0A849KYZ9_9RHOB|nr:N-formylglutamate amidohydrolase [Halovulum dunhuangense]NNU79606.1 N-formylglutamate amidohydrolase [Halovulum dunhuangense]
MQTTDPKPPVTDEIDPAFERLTPDAPGPALVLCDHATNHVPDWIPGGTLGLSDADMGRHIAHDVGAAGVARRLALELDAPAVLSRFSRLVIDPNRGADDPTLVMKLYDGSIIPANRHADEAEVARRRALAYDPYHDAITRTIDAMLARGTVPHIISIHSFTPQLRGKPPRPWHVGVLWDRDGRLAEPLIARLRAEPDLVVGDNEPYTGALRGDCMNVHGTRRGLPHVLIEIRNDLIAEPADQAAWAMRLAPILRDLIAASGVTAGAAVPT